MALSTVFGALQNVVSDPRPYPREVAVLLPPIRHGASTAADEVADSLVASVMAGRPHPSADAEPTIGIARSRWHGMGRRIPLARAVTAAAAAAAAAAASLPLHTALFGLGLRG